MDQSCCLRNLTYLLVLHSIFRPVSAVHQLHKPLRTMRSHTFAMAVGGLIGRNVRSEIGQSKRFEVVADSSCLHLLQ
ncbi:hypothetical protein Pla100_04630 [Neorhodopirellula pilleata]|uniref:Uncharacterized protein n=1 Tax=Neorhodopirellula pilleata TaxID=2714738 RepID=A0A5C6AWT8_9BACT|nr:hypothetical protein Pla100_04630 [Neorhodopirellula pilleata]